MEEGKGLFKLEIALDRMYYDLLFDAAGKLPSRDRELVERILTTEIDLQNINWLIRFSHFYDVSAAEMEKILISRGTRIGVEDITAYLNQESRQREPSALLKGRFPSLSTISMGERGAATQAMLFEQILEETRKTEFMKLISGYPFTIGIILVYFFLKNRECRYLTGILNGKLYGWSPDRIREVTG